MADKTNGLDLDKYVTTEEIMALYHVSQKTVYRWNEAGKIHGVKAGRRLLFPRDEIEALASPMSANCE